MALTDPIDAYQAETNIEAEQICGLLRTHGIEAHTTEEATNFGLGILGSLPGIHRPKVWISRVDAQRTAELLTRFEAEKRMRQPERHRNQASTVTAECEDCGTSSQFPAALNGTVQDCPKCGAFVDVGEFDWPDLDETETAEGDSDESPDTP